LSPPILNPRGAVFYPDLTKALVARYNFQKFPQKLEDFDESKGVAFGFGRLGDTVIEQLVIYTYGIVLDTRISTQESRRLLEESVRVGTQGNSGLYTGQIWSKGGSMQATSRSEVLFR